ncbi:ABC transporter ATP-binding protein [Tumidithrix elongata RA019]|uniref:ABC transporter ATP-binding protein n=1 Tax=Tumidithrix elongata BACA0141 TaxID=2716417 RepID=A0AAW9PPW2_9CYAN|nr:ABC transporter ATP-binding protein [Tumidithrix elongata RA019]
MLQVDKLSKSYGKKQVLQDLSFHLKRGEVYGLLGPNGAGKTTTINILCGLLNADSGTVKLDNRPVSLATRAAIGVAPQENLFYGSLTCEENLYFFAQIYGLRGEKCKESIQTCLKSVGLLDRAKSLAENLSGGMQRRLSVAIALVHQPQLVVLDEPTTGLDIETRYEVWELIRNLSRQEISVLLTTHMLDEAERLCQRIGIIKQGKLLAEGSMESLRQWVPAKEVVTICTPVEDLAIARGNELGFSHRRYGRDLAFWMPKTVELKEIINCFDGIPLDSIVRQPVSLEHIYVEVTQSMGDREISNKQNS